VRRVGCRPRPSRRRWRPCCGDLAGGSGRSERRKSVPPRSCCRVSTP
jgi:hypothetical protein